MFRCCVHPYGNTKDKGGKNKPDTSPIVFHLANRRNMCVCHAVSRKIRTSTGSIRNIAPVGERLSVLDNAKLYVSNVELYWIVHHPP